MGSIFFRQVIDGEEVYYTSKKLKEGYPILDFITGEQWEKKQLNNYKSEKQLPLFDLES